MDQEKVGRFIAQRRKNKKLTQQELAEKLGVSEKAISNWENGRNMPDVSLYKALCDILDISIEELINGEKKRHRSPKNSRNKVITGLCIVIIVLFVILSHFWQKFDIYSIEVSGINEAEVIKVATNKTRDIYYYGIDNVNLCNSDGKCHELKSALKKEKTLDSLNNFLKSQYDLGNLEKYIVYDGGTAIYRSSRFTTIVCNTLDGNHDMYFGGPNMAEFLDGEYCGYSKQKIKKFVRTYHILNVDKSEAKNFSEVTLIDNKNNSETVKINSKYDLEVGKYYEFTFTTRKIYTDTTSNIFTYSHITSISETDLIGNNQRNDIISANQYEDNVSDLNELDDVTMTIKDGTLTNSEAVIVINDSSDMNNVYGAWFRIDKKINGEYQELETTGEEYAFNSMAYMVDENNILEMKAFWKVMYGELESGEYRLVKEVDGKYFSVEFII